MRMHLIAAFAAVTWALTPDAARHSQGALRKGRDRKERVRGAAPRPRRMRGPSIVAALIARCAQCSDADGYRLGIRDAVHLGEATPFSSSPGPRLMAASSLIHIKSPVCASVHA